MYVISELFTQERKIKELGDLPCKQQLRKSYRKGVFPNPLIKQMLHYNGDDIFALEKLCDSLK